MRLFMLTPKKNPVRNIIVKYEKLINWYKGIFLAILQFMKLKEFLFWILTAALPFVIFLTPVSHELSHNSSFASHHNDSHDEAPHSSILSNTVSPALRIRSTQPVPVPFNGVPNHRIVLPELSTDFLGCPSFFRAQAVDLIFFKTHPNKAPPLNL